MKVREILEAASFDDYPELFKFSEEEFAALPAPNASNVEDKYKVSSVAFDQARGFGAVPNNRNVEYLGFVAEMAPSDFIKLAHPGDREDDAQKFTSFIKDRAPMGAPTIYLTVNDADYEDGKPLRAQTNGHEGRGRMTAIKKLIGDALIPVHFILNGGMRARDLSEQFFKDLRSTGIIKEGAAKTDSPMKVDLGKIFWRGNEI